VSPLWRDQIQVFFAPDRLDFVRSYRGIRPKPSTRFAVACERKQGSPAWESPLGQLEQAIADTAGIDISITVSNHFVRYAVVPAQTKIASPSELYAYAAFHMREIYGERAGAWELSMSEWDPCSGGVCAAIERNLLERLEALAIHHKLKLKHIEPYLTGAFDQWRKRFHGERIWFALIEAGRLCIASLSQGAWQRISNQKILHGVEEELLAALDQEALLFSGRKETAESVYLLAPEYPELALPTDCGWHIISLQTESMLAPSLYPAPSMISGSKN
jgi:hypothetical protein